jgi:hypothetical protein
MVRIDRPGKKQIANSLCEDMRDGGVVVLSIVLLLGTRWVG